MIISWRVGVRGAQLCVSVIIGIILHEELFHSFSAVWYDMQVPLTTATIKMRAKSGSYFMLFVFHALYVSCSLKWGIFLRSMNRSDTGCHDHHYDHHRQYHCWDSLKKVADYVCACIFLLETHPLSFFVIATLLIWYCCTFSNVLSFGSFILSVEQAIKEAK